MKKIFLTAFAAISLAGCQQKDAKSTDVTSADSTQTVVSAEAARSEFEETTYDFGTIKQGEVVKYEFSFKNVGKTPLIITSATATCGCTVPEYPVQPIKPGESGVIKVVFNSTGKIDKQDKIVTFISNANPEMEKLHLIGDVKAK